MDFKKTISYALSVVALVSVAACSSVTSPANTNTNVSSSVQAQVQPGQFNPATNSIFIGDAGHGKKGADLSFNLNLPEAAFKTKANGIVAGRAQDINKIRVVVTTSNTDPLLAANTTVFDSGSIPLTGTFTSGTVKKYTISNLTKDGTYYVGVQLFNGTDVLNKLTNFSVGKDEYLALSTQSFSVSSKLGETGIIEVSPATVSISAPLRDGIGGSVEAEVTPTDGQGIGNVTLTPST